MREGFQIIDCPFCNGTGKVVCPHCDVNALEDCCYCRKDDSSKVVVEE